LNDRWPLVINAQRRCADLSTELSLQKTQKGRTFMNFSDQRIWWVIGGIVVILIIWNVAA